MEKAEGRREILFQATMSAAREMLKQGLVGREEYKRFETAMLEKYAPVFGGLFSNIDLIQCG